MTAPEPTIPAVACAAEGRGCGTPTGWRNGGRCPACRAAHNKETRDRRRARNAPDPETITRLRAAVAAGLDVTTAARSLGIHPKTARALVLPAPPTPPSTSVEAMCAHLLRIVAPDHTLAADADHEQTVLWRTFPIYKALEGVLLARGKTSRRQRKIMQVTAFGETKTPTEWGRDPRAAVLGVTISSRIRAGVPAEQAITAPAGSVTVRHTVEDCRAGDACGTSVGWQGGGRCPRCRAAHASVTMEFRREASEVPVADLPGLLTAYRRGDDLQKIAAEHGISSQQVKRVARFYGVKRPQQTAPAERRAAQQLLILDLLRSGDVKLQDAARRAGVSPSVLSRWKGRDPTFAARCDAARAEGIRRAQ